MFRFYQMPKDVSPLNLANSPLDFLSGDIEGRRTKDIRWGVIDRRRTNLRIPPKETPGRNKLVAPPLRKERPEIRSRGNPKAIALNFKSSSNRDVIC